MAREYFVYILTNASHASLYVGVTNDLPRRLAEHRSGMHDGFTKRYRLHQLVFCESTSDVWEALTREKQIKRWRREKKAALVNAVNPTWRDLSDETPHRCRPDRSGEERRDLAPRSVPTSLDRG